MSMTKTQVRALASRLAKVDEELQRAIATLNPHSMTWTVTGPQGGVSTLSPREAIKSALLHIESEIADIKQIMQAAGECEYAREARKA